ncbi:MAG: M23 family metallopeptidase [Woeseiaceae bacterium]
MNKRKNKSVAIRQGLTALAALLLIQNSAYAACDEDWLKVDERRTGDALTILARNANAYPITYAIRVREGESSYRASKSFTGSLDAQETRQLLEVPGVNLGSGELSISCRWTIGRKNAEHDDDHRYLLPYADGTSYRVLQGFGSRFSHRGNEQYAIDFNMPVGTPVHAARDGIVARTVESHNKGCWEDGCGKFANFIVVLHDDGTTGEYYHLQQNGALVAPGDRVTAGQKIGLSGNTGHTTMPHLHFAVYRATSRARSQSVPFSFLSADGVVHKPRRGRHYLAVMHNQVGD